MCDIYLYLLGVSPDLTWLPHGAPKKQRHLRRGRRHMRHRAATDVAPVEQLRQRGALDAIQVSLGMAVEICGGWVVG